MAQRKLLAFTVALTVAIAGWLYYVNTPSGYRIEAETGSVRGPVKVVSDGKFSGSGYIKSTGNRGYVTYRFHIDEHGLYKIKAKGYAQGDDGNSFFVKIDNHKTVTWDMGHKHRAWADMEVTKRHNPNVPGVGSPLVVELEPGYHVIKFTEREKNSGLDYFEFEMVKPVSAASFISGFNVSQFVKGALALSLMALSLVAIRLSRNGGFLGRNVSAPVDARLNALEKRISDMQEIIISLDEQLRRQQKQSTDEVEKV